VLSSAYICLKMPPSIARYSVSTENRDSN
jgi:hypothetical protein